MPSFVPNVSSAAWDSIIATSVTTKEFFFTLFFVLFSSVFFQFQTLESSDDAAYEIRGDVDVCVLVQSWPAHQSVDDKMRSEAVYALAEN